MYGHVLLSIWSFYMTIILPLSWLILPVLIPCRAAHSRLSKPFYPWTLPLTFCLPVSYSSSSPFLVFWLYENYVLFLCTYMCVHVGMALPVLLCECQRTVCGNWFSLYTIPWVLGIKLTLSGSLWAKLTSMETEKNDHCGKVRKIFSLQMSIPFKIQQRGSIKFPYCVRYILIFSTIVNDVLY